MKTITKLFLLCSFIYFLNANAQAPNKFSFQAVVRNTSSQLITNQSVGVKISIISVVMGTENAEFEETHTVTTNANGLFSLKVGEGTLVSGDFESAMNSNAQSKKIKCEIDPTGGTNYTIVSNEQLLSVPYALNANNATYALDAKKTSGINAMTQAVRDALTPSIGAMILNTDTGKPNFYNGTEWLNFDGSSAIPLVVGQLYRGGKIAYIFQPGNPGYVADETHGLIIALSDMATVKWGCYGIGIFGADGYVTGTGAANTLDILKTCPSVSGGHAAKLCSNATIGSYTDWYLPSIGELQAMHENNALLGDTFPPVVWSSTEFDNNGAYYFSGGYTAIEVKDWLLPVRAVRAF